MSKLHADSIRKQFGGLQILSDIFLDCKPGEVVGLLGRNGSGKSTLLKILFGSDRADFKYMYVDGKIINTVRDSRGLVKYLYQDHFLPSHIKIKSVILLYCNPDNAKFLTDHRLVKPFLNNKPSELSGGELRLIEMLIILHADAKYLLLDEPFNGLSPLNADFLKDSIVNQAKNGKGIILTDHNFRNVLAIATKTVLLKDGNTKVVNGIEDLISLGYLPRDTTI